MAILLIQGECTAHTTAGNAFGANDIRTNVDTTEGFTSPANRQGQRAQGDTAVSFYPVEAAPNAAGVFWLHARVEADTANTANFAFNSDIAPDLEIIVGGPDNRVQIETSTTVVAQTSRTPATTFDVDVELATASGNWKIYVDSVEVASGTGNATVQALDLTTLTKIYATGGASFSELVVTQDESTIGARVVVLNPDAEGSSTDMTGDINNINNNGLTADGYIIEGAGSQTFSYSNMPAEFANDFVIKAVSVDTVASAADAATAKEMTPLVDGNPLTSEVLGVNSNDSTVTRIMTAHPDSSKWTLAKLDALEVGVRFALGRPENFAAEFIMRNLGGDDYGTRTLSDFNTPTLPNDTDNITEIIYVFSTDSFVLKVDGQWGSVTDGRCYFYSEADQTSSPAWNVFWNNSNSQYEEVGGSVPSMYQWCLDHVGQPVSLIFEVTAGTAP